ncbi:MAG: hypothetical protein JSU87_15450, partial [Gemmatimonadota bacterium]
MSRWPMFGCYLILTLATLWTIEAASLGGIDRPALQFAAGEGDLHRVLSVADPQEVIKGVREAQADLERRRRAEVPRWKSLTCDDKVGRHCLLFPPYREYRLESDSLRQAREALLGSLAAAGNAMPGDEWVLGQRIRYLLEGGQKRQALELTLDCRVERRWWCSALAGYVLHQMQRYEPADSAFEVARAAMPDAERRRWNDISVFLDDELGKAYREATAEGRDSLERRFWWLADPLYVIAGNDRRTEHYARHVQSTLLAEAESGFGEIDESDLRQIIVRHGLPSNWVTFEAVTSRQGDWLMPKRIFDAPLVAVYYPQRRRFVPHPRFLLDPTSIKPREWELEPEAPRASYDPLHLSFFGRLEHQVAV